MAIMEIILTTVACHKKALHPQILTGTWLYETVDLGAELVSDDELINFIRDQIQKRHDELLG